VSLSKNLTNPAAENYTLVHYFCRFFVPVEMADFSLALVENLGANQASGSRSAQQRNRVSRSRSSPGLRPGVGFYAGGQRVTEWRATPGRSPGLDVMCNLTVGALRPPAEPVAFVRPRRRVDVAGHIADAPGEGGRKSWPKSLCTNPQRGDTMSGRAATHLPRLRSNSQSDQGAAPEAHR
jgi:hypothetical protein